MQKNKLMTFREPCCPHCSVKVMDKLVVAVSERLDFSYRKQEVCVVQISKTIMIHILHTCYVQYIVHKRKVTMEVKNFIFK